MSASSAVRSTKRVTRRLPAAVVTGSLALTAFMSSPAFADTSSVATGTAASAKRDADPIGALANKMAADIAREVADEFAAEAQKGAVPAPVPAPADNANRNRTAQELVDSVRELAAQGPDRALGSKAAMASPFPVKETFSGATAPDWKLDGSAKLDGGWLKLTPAETDKKGVALLQKAFPSTQGFTVEFDYAAYGGTKFTDGHTGFDHYGDGFSAFLIDGAKDSGPGATGPGLGYSCAFCKPGDPRPAPREGVTGGYIGVGFDEYGNYAGDAAGNGHGSEPFGGFDNALGYSPDTVSVRGSGDKNTGFEYLTGTKPGVGIEGDRGAGKKVKLSYDGKGKLSVTLNGKVVIKDYDITKGKGQTALPATLKLGFGASTGGATRNYEIRNVVINAPADLGLKKTGTAKVVSGGKVTYTLTVTNKGPANAMGATVVDAVPSSIVGTTYKCAATMGAKCGAGSSGSGNNINAKVDIPVGGKATITIMGTASKAGNVVNTAKVTPPPTVTDPNPKDNTSTTTTTVTKKTPDKKPKPDGGGGHKPGHGMP
ncbi:hypothetical protein OG897_08230 [Streptomyces sp. NBC_00237]|uniref:hypothetical protein n=1 Tax=Streptomyces sp. NBC_00237 TaxID=2975687 RepID=UPI00225876ED|nr:hypothetical protein [Streptomyces sp. NBC_00237]MCX5201439.1 hypothetical protein [Streptomyces sp. NBC_00237]